ncbi:hypothetical protein ETAR_10360 [Edwardsiella tarda]|nr:hypothetical protein GBS0709_10240 [Edwardsiella tarda]GAC64186.1 hypothetical protein ET1_09_01070 [Edwardsiella tarda ATCC 15947 = NBRC 105688]
MTRIGARSGQGIQFTHGTREIQWHDGVGAMAAGGRSMLDWTICVRRDLRGPA